MPFHGMTTAYALMFGYLWGNMVFAYIFGRIFRHLDIREHGNKNPGTMNSIKVLGWPFAFAVFFGDVLKSVVPMVIGKYVFGWTLPDQLWIGLGAILGHCFPFWLSFRGGKGTASALGLLVTIDWRIAAIVSAILVILAFAANRSVAGSISSYVAIPVLFGLFRYPAEAVLVSGIIAIVLILITIPLLIRTLRGVQPSVADSVLGKSKT